MTFQSVLPPHQRRPKAQNRWPSKIAALSYIIANNFNLSTILLLGAVLQAILVLAIPTIYALIPALALLVLRGLDTLAITYGIRANPYLQDVIFKKVSAQVPDADGNFPEKAAGEKIAILMLGAKCNHPLGIFAPNFRKEGDYVEQMTRQLDRDAPDNGFLGQSSWTSRDKNGALEVILISYWRSIDDLHIFAHSPLHREAWQWWEKTLKENDHLGINHEIYSAEKGQWENVYANFQPTGLGATTYLKKGDKLVGGVVPDMWVSPLIQANKGQLRTSAGRLGWAPATQHDQYGPNVYE